MNTHNGTGERFDGGETPEVANFHPTVKPIKLMRWLCRLIGGKKGSVILDTFCGSGTTGCAAILEGYEFVGIEITPDYLPIIRGRLNWAQEEYMTENAQLSLFEDAI
jgi:site-specific DNA-methyltransferase (adenine-specific)